MEKIRFQNWDFSVDTAKTRNFYVSSPVTLNSIESLPPALTAFLDSLYIDVRKPSATAEDELCYYFFGTAVSADGYELDFCDTDKLISVVIYPGGQISPNPDKVILEIFGIKI